MRRGRRPNITTDDIGTPDSVNAEASQPINQLRSQLNTSMEGITLDSPIMQEYVRDLKFNEDILEISIGMTSDKNAPNPVECGCNGEFKRLFRGQRYKLARKFVDSLISSSFSVNTKEYEDGNGLRQSTFEKIPNATFAITIHDDPANRDGSDLGKRWFEYKVANSY